MQGGIATLQATAASPVVAERHTAEMGAYFRRVHASAGKLFTGGIGWIDANGNVRASSLKSHRRPSTSATATTSSGSSRPGSRTSARA